jgi:hypothetical protein
MRAFSVPIEIGMEALVLHSTGFLHANRYPRRIKARGRLSPENGLAHQRLTMRARHSPKINATRQNRAELATW